VDGEHPEYQIPDQVYLREVNGQLVLLNLDTEQYFGLDEVGAVIVGKLTEVPVATALSDLLAMFDVDSDRLTSDVNNLVASLLDAGLLERR
jgi:Coenzyme PQQ synthesis protein D (PqqD)